MIMLGGLMFCLNPLVLLFFIGGILAGLLPLWFGLRASIRRGRRKTMEREMEDEEDEEEEEEEEEEEVDE